MVIVNTDQEVFGFSENSRVMMWSVALRGLTLCHDVMMSRCHVISSWLNNYSIKIDEKKETKVGYTTTVVA